VLERTEIVATDISDRALTRARNGGFGSRAVRAVNLPSEALRWLDIRQNPPRVDARVYQGVRFGKVNLLDAEAIGALGSFDVILCRNVMIYFSDETIRRVVAHLTQALLPNGVLLVGASESLLRFETALTCEERKGIFLYRKCA
jgi:chemotaxis protein methyltransferase CheR